jgi:UDP-glucose 4-epimerase
MKKILITGANSYLGTSLETFLLQWPDQYMVDTIDLIDGAWREKSFSAYDVVYHVAGIAHSDMRREKDEGKSLYKLINTALAIETASKAKAEGVKQFIFMSSSSVYGDCAPIGRSKMITRETLPCPMNNYGLSKLHAEEGILLLQDVSFRIAIIRSPMIYGRGCKGNYPLLRKLALLLPLFPRIENQRSMLYIESLVEFIKLMIDNDEGGIFWPQNREYVNTSDLVKLIAEKHGKKIYLVNGIYWAVMLLGHVSSRVMKAFGNLTYDQELSNYKADYRTTDLKTSIRDIED